MLELQENVPLAPLTTLKIGGPARYLATVSDEEDLREALVLAREKGLPFGILGGGSNLLVSDDGFPGVMIRLKMDRVTVSGTEVEAEAGVDLTWLVMRTAELGLSGMEPLAGIPGLLGGALRGNAGAYGGCIGEVARRVRALDAGSLAPVELSREECQFSYRSSRFKRDGRLIVLSAQLALSTAAPEVARQRAEATIARREARGLQCDRSVGSFFMNPVVADPDLIRRFETEQGVRCRECRIPAGWLIDRSGLRNARVGDAVVSPLHANYLVNAGSATAAEMAELAALVKGKVFAATGVELQEEVSCLGVVMRPA